MQELDNYQLYLSRQPISVHTRRNYLLRVRAFLAWLADSPEAAKALVDQVERDFALRDYSSYLLHKGASANTVNGSLTALDNYFVHWKGMPALKLRRQQLPEASPKALEPAELSRLLKVIAQCKSLRNQVIALVMLHCGLRISEVAGLNVGDVLLTARRRELVVRHGKGGKRRVVPINRDLAEVLQRYLTCDSVPETPLLVGQRGNRLTVQAIDYVIQQFGNYAGIDFSSHSLRHTCLTKLVRSGIDLVLVAELAGHSRLETTRRYALPTYSDRVRAMEKLNYGATAT